MSNKTIIPSEDRGKEWAYLPSYVMATGYLDHSTNEQFAPKMDANVQATADSGYFYLSQGITRINGVSVIQNSLPDGSLQQE